MPKRPEGLQDFSLSEDNLLRLLASLQSDIDKWQRYKRSYVQQHLGQKGSLEYTEAMAEVNAKIAEDRSVFDKVYYMLATHPQPNLEPAPATTRDAGFLEADLMRIYHALERDIVGYKHDRMSYIRRNYSKRGTAEYVDALGFMKERQMYDMRIINKILDALGL